MYSAQILLNEFGAPGEAFEIEQPEQWILGEFGERQPSLAVEDAWLELSFAARPTASALAASLLAIDREARRTVTAIERRVPPVELYGRGRRLRPLKEGLLVRSAREGSLNVEVLLGEIYTVVTSQPLSFALNLASLLGYVRITVLALQPHGEPQRKRGTVRPTRRVIERGAYEDAIAPVMRIPTPHGDIVVPEGFRQLRLHMRCADGSSIELQMGPDQRPD